MQNHFNLSEKQEILQQRKIEIVSFKYNFFLESTNYYTTLLLHSHFYIKSFT